MDEYLYQAEALALDSLDWLAPQPVRYPVDCPGSVLGMVPLLARSTTEHAEDEVHYLYAIVGREGRLWRLRWHQ